MTKNTIQIGVQVTPEQNHILNCIAEARKVSRSAVVRAALDQFRGLVEQEKTKPKPKKPAKGVLGSRLRETRLNKEMTLLELAQKCDTYPDHIGRIERGDINNISIYMLMSLCIHLDVSSDYLLGLINTNDTF